MTMSFTVIGADDDNIMPFGVNLAGAEFYHKKMEPC